MNRRQPSGFCSITIQRGLSKSSPESLKRAENGLFFTILPIKYVWHSCCTYLAWKNQEQGGSGYGNVSFQRYVHRSFHPFFIFFIVLCGPDCRSDRAHGETVHV